MRCRNDRLAASMLIGRHTTPAFQDENSEA
jgi:hypothetical protein